MVTKKEAYLYKKLDDNSVRCLTCGHKCTIKENKFGICQTRKNIGGTCYSLIYGALSAESLDPIEKKPLFHFYPGHLVYSISCVGCSFKCKNCQNYHLSMTKVTDEEAKFVDYSNRSINLKVKTPAELIESIKKSGCELLAFTYNEPLIWLEYIVDVCQLAREEGIKIVLVSNGYSTPEAVEMLAPCVDAANIDIKAFSSEFYKKICAVPDFSPVLDTVKYFHKNGVFVEITNLIIPTLNDKDEDIKNLCNWCMDNLGPSVPIHFSAYRPMYKLNLPSTPVKTLIKARNIAKQLGFHHVYVGNARVQDAENTYCPECNNEVISRNGYMITRNGLKDGNKCKACGNQLNIAGNARKTRRYY